MKGVERVTILLFTLIVAGSCVGRCAVDLPGDLDGDCHVGSKDLGLFADDWLEYSDLAGNIYYAQPNGTGDGTTPNRPMKIADFWSVANPGDTLVLLDGLYQGDGNMIQPPPILWGCKDAPVTIRAENDGGATIDGEDVRQPVRLYRNPYFSLVGFNACNSSNSVVLVERSSNVEVKRVCAWDARDGNCVVFLATESDFVLFEDCAGWGIARKIFSNSMRGNYCTYRRCWGRWDGCHNVGPKMVFTAYYNSWGARFENCVGYWSAKLMQESYTLLDDNKDDGLWRDGNGNTKQYYNYQVQDAHAVFGIDDNALAFGQARPVHEDCVAYTCSDRHPNALFKCKPSSNSGDCYTIRNSMAWQYSNDHTGFDLYQSSPSGCCQACCEVNNIKWRFDNNLVCPDTQQGDVNPCDILPLPISDRVKSLTGHDWKDCVHCSGQTVYYAEPDGTGSGNSDDPMSVGRFLTIAQPGYTLILKDGTYSGPDGLLTPPNNLDGTATDPITILAENDGKAVIDGSSNSTPVNLVSNDYWAIEGIRVRNSGEHVLNFHNCTNIKLNRITGHDAGTTGYNSVFYFWVCNDISVENCAGWGYADKIFNVYTACDNIQLVHCFGKFENSASNGAKGVFYCQGSNNVSYDRCIGLVAPANTEITSLNGAFNGNVTVTDCVGINRNRPKPTGIFRHTGTNDPPNCTAILNNCLAHSETGGVYGYYLINCEANQIEAYNCIVGCFTPCACVEGTFDPSQIGAWPMRERILAEAGEDVEALY